MRSGHTGSYVFHVLQFYETVCARVFWKVEIVFFLDVIRQEPSGQEMLSRETHGTFLWCCEWDENFWGDPILVCFLYVPTWRTRAEERRQWGIWLKATHEETWSGTSLRVGVHLPRPIGWTREGNILEIISFLFLLLYLHHQEVMSASPQEEDADIRAVCSMGFMAGTEISLQRSISGWHQ